MVEDYCDIYVPGIDGGYSDLGREEDHCYQSFTLGTRRGGLDYLKSGFTIGGLNNPAMIGGSDRL
jgi:hypothetical protein